MTVEELILYCQAMVDFYRLWPASTQQGGLKLTIYEALVVALSQLRDAGAVRRCVRCDHLADAHIPSTTYRGEALDGLPATFLTPARCFGGVCHCPEFAAPPVPPEGETPLPARSPAALERLELKAEWQSVIVPVTCELTAVADVPFATPVTLEAGVVYEVWVDAEGVAQVRRPER